MNTTKNKGVSVIICCYNSSARLQKTLDALAKQQYSPALLWEIIMVDNNSSDNTTQVAAEVWKKSGAKIPFKIVTEPRQGLGNARNKGITETMYSYLLFCDDDNWLAPNYVQGVFDILESDPNIAACGGMGIPVFETKEPDWFYVYAESFALGSQEINSEDGRILNLYGAGMAVSKKVLDQLYHSGFSPILSGRTGKELSSSEDTELTYAFVLMGYELACSDELKFFHYLPKERLTFEYLKRLHVAFGDDGPIRNLYYAYVSKRKFHRQVTNWNLHFLLNIYRFIKYLLVPPKKFGRSIYFSWNIAYLKRLLSIRKKYGQLKKQIEKIRDMNGNEPHGANSKKSNLILEKVDRN